MAATAVQTLDLSTLSEDAPIKIDGTLYGVKHPDNLSLVDYKQLETDLPILGRLLIKAKLTPQEGKEARRLLIEVTDTVLDVPEAIRAKLKDSQRIAVLDVFMKLRPEMTATTAEAPQRVRRRTGGKSFRR